MNSKHSLFTSFKFAFEGLKSAFIKGRNFRIQIAATVLVFILGLIFNLSSLEWLDLVVVITLVLILELINTSIEAMVDLVSPEIHEKAKLAKDVAAGAVFIASVGSVIIGVLVFLPKLLS
ncbi:MAG TPA: diacylglycerol kinase family protein [Patescibacteria group bacterium]|nr:diacylglycerol kinase family protein [Patescibacteria group bacterium]